MSLPPTMLRIKRKRTEDPVESLYIETSAASKRVRTEASYVFRRLPQSSHSQKKQTPSSTPPTAGSQLDVHHPVTSSVTRGGIAPASSSGKSSSSSGNPTINGTTYPRRFLLSRSSIELSNVNDRVNEATSRQYKQNIALLVEDRRPKTTAPSRQGPHQPESATITAVPSTPRSQEPSRQPIVAQKRPSAKHGIPRPPPIRKRTQSIGQERLAAFEKWAGEELGGLIVGDSTAPHSLTDPSASAGNGQAGTSKRSTDAMDMDDDGDYVYDTYVRHVAEFPSEASFLSDLSSHTNSVSKGPGAEFNPYHGNVGYLVISDSDVELWDTYASDPDEADGKDDWDSEQDDENAENYYGADYPEDEVSSGDEYGEDSYRYRRKAGGVSDDEEYDLAENSADDELKPWETKSGVRSGIFRRGVGEVLLQEDELS